VVFIPFPLKYLEVPSFIGIKVPAKVGVETTYTVSVSVSVTTRGVEVETATTAFGVHVAGHTKGVLVGISVIEVTTFVIFTVGGNVGNCAKGKAEQPTNKNGNKIVIIHFFIFSLF